MKTRRLGKLDVSEIGFGTMSFASTYGASPDRAEAIRVIRGAYDCGVTFFDTAEVYRPFTNEELVGEAVAPFRDKVVIASKFGFDVNPDTGARIPGVNSNPAHIRRAVDGKISVLGARLPEAILQLSYR
jgi:aryl-alcohol dehydrogenase-like predicted oxidoreductase